MPGFESTIFQTTARLWHVSTAVGALQGFTDRDSAFRIMPAERGDRADSAERLLGLAGVSPVEEQVVVGVPDGFGRRDFLKVLRYA